MQRFLLLRMKLLINFIQFLMSLTRVWKLSLTLLTRNLSQVMSSSNHDVVEQDVFTSQDVSDCSLSAPPPVAVHFKIYP